MKRFGFAALGVVVILGWLAACRTVETAAGAQRVQIFVRLLGTSG